MRRPEETGAPAGAPPSAAKPRRWEQPHMSAKIRNECQVYFRDAYFYFYVSLLQLFPIWQQQFLTLPFDATKPALFPGILFSVEREFRWICQKQGPGLSQQLNTWLGWVVVCRKPWGGCRWRRVSLG